MKVLKHSRQRDCIKTFLEGRVDHPTADVVYQNIREELPNISLGTVYRNLNLLADLGEIQKLACGDGKDHFDGNPQPHYHFICHECGAVEDLALAKMENVDQLAQKSTENRIDGHQIYFHGVCKGCLSEKTV